MRSRMQWQRADLFRRVPRDLTEASTTGGIISVACIAVILVLFVGEVIGFLIPRVRSDMVVAPDTDDGKKLRVTLDMVFPFLPCALLSVDVMDILNNHEINSMTHLTKTPISEDGKDIRDSRASPESFVSPNEGCHISGYIKVAKVPGNFHISAHGKNHLLKEMRGAPIRVQHVIRHLSFGDAAVTPWSTPLMRALDGTSQLEKNTFTYHYYLDVVPTLHEGTFSTTKAYQFTSHSSKAALPSPGYMAAVVFHHQLSPITVKYSSGRVAFTHFLTYVCAIIGGVFTVAGLLSRLTHSSISHIQKRFLNKKD